VVFPVPLGPNRKNERDGSANRRGNIASILAVKMMDVYTEMPKRGIPA
jgi:hypothetical protein